MYKSTITLLLFFVLPLQITFSQNFKFGKVSKEELEEKFYPLDSSANAAFLYKKRNTYTTVLGGKIQLINEIQVRLKIYKKEGFDWATEKVGLFTRNNSQKLSNLKAITYNLENGEIVETKFDKKNIFVTKESENWSTKKFTMPNIKEGSVLEWTYKIYSSYFSSINEMVVQYKIPVKKYESRVKLLEWFHFNKRQKGYYPFRIKQSYSRNASLDTNDNIIEISESNIPAIIDEPFVNNLNNYTAGLKLEVASLNAPKFGIYQNFATSWEEIAKDIFKSSSFGDELKKISHFKDDLISLVNVSAPEREKISEILKLVKNKIKWNDHRGKYTYDGVKKAYKEGVGNVAEINLTLVAMLREAGLNANPVLISTRNNGIPIFPTNSGLNFVIACVELNNEVILLDATEKYSTPNVLPMRDLNWQGRIVRKNGSSSPVDLLPKKHSKETVFLNVEIDDEGTISGMQRNTYSNLRALQSRNNNNDISEDELISKLEKNNNDIEIEEFKAINKNEIAKPLIYHYSFETDNQVEIIGDKMYFSPLLHLTEEENPFKLEDRKYPVDFGTPWEERYSITIQIPEGYVVETKPENVAYVLPENLGSFKFVSKLNANKLQILSITKINAPIIGTNYYAALKDSYKNAIEKQLEKVVLVKKSI